MIQFRKPPKVYGKLARKDDNSCCYATSYSQNFCKPRCYIISNLSSHLSIMSQVFRKHDRKTLQKRLKPRVQILIAL